MIVVVTSHVTLNLILYYIIKYVFDCLSYKIVTGSSMFAVYDVQTMQVCY